MVRRMNAIVTISKVRAFDDALAERILERVADGETLTDAAIGEGFSAQGFLRWTAAIPETAQAYARARQARADVLADRIIPLSQEARDAVSAHTVQAIKLEVDSLKWLTSKLAPSTYGDKLDVTSAGKALATPVHQVDARVQSIIMMAAERMRLATGAELSDEAKGLLD